MRFRFNHVYLSPRYVFKGNYIQNMVHHASHPSNSPCLLHAFSPSNEGYRSDLVRVAIIMKADLFRYFDDGHERDNEVKRYRDLFAIFTNRISKVSVHRDQHRRASMVRENKETWEKTKEGSAPVYFFMEA